MLLQPSDDMRFRELNDRGFNAVNRFFLGGGVIGNIEGGRVIGNIRLVPI